MKRLISLVLILALAAALCACGETTVIEKEVEKTVEVPVVPEEYGKYQELLDALNAGDYDAARDFVEQMMPEPEKPPVTEIEITTENFLDYFEFVEIPEYGLRIEYLSSGEPAAVFASPGYFLKEEYQVDPEHIDDINITADVRYNYWILAYDQMIIDFDTPSYELAYEPKVPNNTLQIKTETLQALYNEPWLHFNFRYSEALLNDYANYAATIIEPFELLSASGTLWLIG